ncbi:Mitochondria fission 1 protein [Wickerhamiella sorbophila]|uniref:Mitochondrial fission 1 protein n=1 Tax=Wickerhamiella sorbophila TaxID=45607 RepID=A0A2T0FFS6_9ASCO|nr:Mitochondria fission 1 protein [Wickerhamiella sorbophila]PRT53809.1 Mitochondria fission 1 protein [Wickerhamiella sorbophila]
MNATTYYASLEECKKPLPNEELEILAKQYNREGDHASIQTRFNYAWGLIKSNDPEHQRMGVEILTQLFKSAPERRRDSLYYLSIGCYKLGDYTNARRYADALLRYDPTNPQINQLRQEIEDKLNKEGMIGMAIVGGAVAVGAAVLGAMLRRRR